MHFPFSSTHNSIHIYIILDVEFICVTPETSGRFTVFHDPMRTVLSENVSFSRFRGAQGVTMIGVLAAHIMHQNTTSTDIIGMEILDLEVEDLNWLIQLLAMDGVNESILAVL